MSVSPFSSAHRLYIKSLYKRMLKNEQDWVIRYDLFRARALTIRAQFEENRNVHDPRALAAILEKAEADLARRKHPDPYIPGEFPGGTKWERNAPPPLGPIFDHLAHDSHH
ncbi:NDUFB9, NADH-ubiquinone oxidoreductase [Artomyces pyxidatus]|uniref:NDUFB9, NADH-ubiquinone oxidoreductase n=1 Tax=Artomyces pyxidatus TaxID=48021 RepID=A0ACB8SMU7_9AGAM|nr:NDUFB9, NADH-ubiquinone oxidoreductase [Artomyces pyxidatus]